MTTRVNHETASDPHPVEQSIAIPVGGTLFRFALILPRYVYGKLTQEDWMRAGERLRTERDRHVSNALVAGVYFTDAGFQQVKNRIRQSMCDLIYERFTERQMEAGNEAWAVPETLQTTVNA